MNTKQKIAIIAPPVLIGLEYILFQLLAKSLGDTLGWYFGLVIYWFIWGGVFSLWLIGKDNLRDLIKPQPLTWNIALLLAVPIIGSLAYKLVPTMNYRQDSFWLSVMMISTAFGNGFFEEVLWRGIYLKLFPKNLYIRVIWASIWFTLWHYVPGSITKDANPIPLMIGSGLFGIVLSYIAHKSKSIWWCIISHVVGGLIMVS